MKKFLIVCGILAPILYVFAVILGGALDPTYSHIRQPVSDLMATGAQNKSLIDVLMAVYNLLTLAFGIGVFWVVRKDLENRRKMVGNIGALLLIAEGLFGVLILLFPEEEGGMAATISATGTIHIVFAGLSSVTTMASMLLLGFWFNTSANLQKASLYSFLSVATVFVSGGLAAMSIAYQNPFGGLIERVTIGGFIQWVFVLALMILPTLSKETNKSK